MRGSPAVRLLIIVIAMGLMVIPLRYVTSKTVPTTSAVKPMEKAAMESVVQLTISATTVLDFEIHHLGKTVWKGEADATTQKTDLQMPFPAEGIELVVLGEIKGGTLPAALRLTVASGNNAEIEKTVWVESRTVDEVLLFKP